MNLAKVLYPIAELVLGRKIRRKLKELRIWLELSDDQKRRYSLLKLHQILVWSQQTVPYYRDLFKEVNFNPDLVLHSSEELLKIPYLTKDILREQGDRLLSDQFAKSELHQRKTNGSTGISTDVFYDDEALDWGAAANLVTYDFTGRSFNQKEVHLSSAYVDPVLARDKVREWLKCLAMGRDTIYTQDFSDQGLQNLLLDLEKARPYLVQGHPSTFYFLALYAEKHGLSRFPLAKSIEATAETLDPKRAEFIEKVFGCKVFNRYGNAEFGVMAHSRNDGRELEVFDFNVWPENRVLNDGRKEIVCTGLLNKAMPLIRYQTGDIGDFFVRSNKPFFGNIVGREHDLISVKGELFPTHYIKDNIERWKGVDEWQIVKSRTSGEKSKIRLVPNADCNVNEIRKKVSDLLGEEYVVEFVELKDLYLTGWRDKFRYIVQEPLKFESYQ